MRKSFTLVEILISVSILVLIVLSTFSILYLGDLNYKRDSLLLELHQEARIALDRMSRELRQASTINITDENKRIFFSIPNRQENNTTYYNITYYLDTNSNQIIREYPQGTTKVLGNNVSYLGFSQDGNTVTVNLTTSKPLRGAPLSFNLSEKIKLRN